MATRKKGKRANRPLGRQAAGAVRAPHGGVAVDEEQRRHLIECCAFFRANRFRPVRPGEYRKEDLLEAEARIDAILDEHKPK